MGGVPETENPAVRLQLRLGHQLSQKPSLWFSAAILGHQALEMLIKAALIRKGHSIDRSDIWGHDLRKLAERLAFHADLPPEVVTDLDTFTDLFNELRYPSELERVK
jgi:HEPN domain-containing protein